MKRGMKAKGAVLGFISIVVIAGFLLGALAQAAETLTSFSVTVSGTPAAVPLIVPKLERMSLRTMPLCVSTLTTPLLLELVPSPG